MEEEMFEEEWQFIDGYPDYIVSNYGRVFNNRFGYFMTPSINSRGYLVVRLTTNKYRADTLQTHRLVAIAFVPGYFEGAEINHIDTDKTYNVADNLEWVTHRENMLHAQENELISSTLGTHSRNKKIRVIETDEVFTSISNCSRSMGISRPGISAVLIGQQRTHKGYTFEYAD